MVLYPPFALDDALRQPLKDMGGVVWLNGESQRIQLLHNSQLPGVHLRVLHLRVHALDAQSVVDRSGDIARAISASLR